MIDNLCKILSLRPPKEFKSLISDQLLDEKNSYILIRDVDHALLGLNDKYLNEKEVDIKFWYNRYTQSASYRGVIRISLIDMLQYLKEGDIKIMEQ